VLPILSLFRGAGTAGLVSADGGEYMDGGTADERGVSGSMAGAGTGEGE
jgi:hypothetical protein